MNNEPAEQLRSFLREFEMAYEGPMALIDKALTTQRKATVDQIRTLLKESRPFSARTAGEWPNVALDARVVLSILDEVAR